MRCAFRSTSVAKVLWQLVQGKAVERAEEEFAAEEEEEEVVVVVDVVIEREFAEVLL